MRKNITRIVALVLCAVMLLGMVPLFANAAQIQPRGIFELVPNQYMFDSFDDLIEIASGTYSQSTMFYNYDELVISEDLVLPENVCLYVSTLTIPENVTVSGYRLSCMNLTIEGTADFQRVIATAPGGGPTRLEVSGSLHVQEHFATQSDTEIVGMDHITLDPEVTFSTTFAISPVEGQLKDAVAKVKECTDPRQTFTIDWMQYNTMEFTESIDIPANCSVVGSMMIPEGVTVNVGGSITAKEMWVAGELITPKLNLQVWVVDRLYITETGSADIESIHVTSGMDEEITTVDYCLAGLDLSMYHIESDGNGGMLLTRKDGSQTLPGDVSGDGIVDNGDVAALLWYTLFPDSHTILGNADFNSDGMVDSADVAYLLWHTLFPDAYPLN